jgi:predicted translation initiation factor SUI1
MPKPQKAILFLALDAGEAKAAADAFGVAAQRLGMSWDVRSAAAGDMYLLGDVSVLVVWRELSFDIKDWEGSVIEWSPGRDLTQAIHKLVARLLGGRDDAPDPAREPGLPKPATPKKVHTVKLSRETAGRRGKGVTVVSDLPLTEDQLKELATKLKNACGTGGTAKDGRLEIQGDHRDKLAAELEKLGYKVKRAGG